MDLYCKCGEPWDMDSLHDICEDLLHAGDTRDYESIWQEAKQNFRKQGCRLFGCDCTNAPNNDRYNIQEALFEVLGDDIDGVASTMEDFNI